MKSEALNFKARLLSWVTPVASRENGASVDEVPNMLNRERQEKELPPHHHPSASPLLPYFCVDSYFSKVYAETNENPVNSPTHLSSLPTLRQKSENKNQYWVDRVNAIHQGIGGAGAGAAASLVTCPLDVTKVRLQVQRTRPDVSQYVGVSGTLRRILADEGIRGLYRGLGVTLVAMVPNWTIYFTAYNQAKRTLERKGGIQEGPVLHMGAAALAGAFTNLCTNPFWVVKTRLQSQHFTQLTSGHRLYTSTAHAFRTICREEGVRALWNGLTPQLMGITHVMVQFPFYEYLKKVMRERNHLSSNDQLNPLQLIMASSVSKVVASSAAYPHEVVRARFQSQRFTDVHRYHGVRDAVRRILLEEGISGFYRGMGTNLMRVVPSCAITFTLYELIQRNVKQKLLDCHCIENVE